MQKILIIIICIVIAVFAILFLWISNPGSFFTSSATHGILLNGTTTPVVDGANSGADSQAGAVATKYPEITFTPIALSPTLVSGTIHVGLFSKNISVPVTYKNGGYVANTTLDLSALNLVGLSKYKQANVQVNVTLK